MTKLTDDELREIEAELQAQKYRCDADPELQDEEQRLTYSSHAWKLLRHISALDSAVTDVWVEYKPTCLADLPDADAEYVVLQKHRVTGTLYRDICRGREFDNYTAYYFSRPLPAPFAPKQTGEQT